MISAISNLYIVMHIEQKLWTQRDGWQSKSEPLQHTQQLVFVFGGRAEVQKQDYKLTPGIYVGTEAEEDDGIPFEEKMEGLKAQLLMQFEKGEELKEKIKANFDKIL